MVQYLEFLGSSELWFDGTILITKSISKVCRLIHYFSSSMQPTLVTITLFCNNIIDTLQVSTKNVGYLQNMFTTSET